jgi:hypothetical protein
LQQLSSGRDWLLFFLIQSCRSHELRKKILNLDDDEITLENVLALTRKYESTEVACNDKDTINNIFVKKEKKGGKARPSQPVQQPQATQSSTNVNAKANQTGAKRPCNHCGGGVHLQAQAELPCTNCKKEGSPHSLLPQRKAFERERTSCFCISNSTI